MTYELGHAYVTILPSMNKFKKEFAKDMGRYVPKEGQKQGESMGKSLWGGVASSATKWAKRGAVGAAAVVTGVLGTAVVKGYQRLNNIENAEAMMSGLGFDEKEIDRIGKQTMAAVTGTAYGFGDAMSVASTAVAAGVTDIEGYITSIADISSLTQRDLGEVGGIFNKVMSRGRVTMEEINQLPQLPLRQNIAEFYGVTEEAAEKMISTGKVTADDFMEIMAQYDGAADEAGKTTAGAFANMQAALGRFGEMLLKDFYPLLAPMFSKAGELIGKATTYLSPHIERFATILSGGLSTALRGVWDFIKRFFVPVWDEIAGGLKAFTAAWQYNDGEVTSSGFPGMMERIGYFARQAFDYIKNTAIPAFKTFVGWFTSGEGAGGIFKSALSGIWTVIKDLFGYVKRNVLPVIGNFITEFKNGEGAGGAFKDVLNGLKDAVVSAFGYVNDTAIPAIQSMYDWMKKNSESLKTAAMYLGALALGVLAYRGYVAAANAVNAIWEAWQKRNLILTKAQTIAQRALNLVMSLNPVGLVIAAIVALVAIIAIAYNRHEGFRNLVNRVWASIKAAIFGVVDWFKNTAWPWMKGVFDAMGKAVMFLWNNVYKPYFTFILNIVKSVAGWVKNTAWPWLRDTFTKIGTAAVGLYQNAIKPAWDSIKAALDAVVKWIMNTAWPWMRDTFTKIADKATDLKDKAVNAFNLIKDGVSKAWDGAKKILDRFKSGLDSLKDKFTSVKDGIGRIWSTLGSALAKPINVVIETVNKFLNNVQEKLNDIPGVSLGGKWGAIPTVPVPAGTTSSASTAGRRGAGGAVMLAAGGQVPGWSPNDKADNIPAWLTAGEYVLPVKATERLRSMLGDTGLEHLRRGNLPGYADGGHIGDGRGGVVGWAKDKWDDVIGFFENAKDWVKGVWNRLMPNFGDSWAGQAVKGVMGNIDLGKVANAVKEKVTGSLGGSNASGSGAAMPWQAIWSLVKSIAPEARMTSNYRPGARTAGYGNLSYHARGRAIDIVSGNMMATYQKVVGAMPWSEALFSPAGGRQVRNGRYYMETNPKTRADHWDHIHLAMAKGGLVPNLYDNGGAIPPGLSLVANQTGKPEQVLTDNQWQDIKQGGGNTIIVNGVKTDNAAQVAEEILFAQRRTGYGKYYRNR